MCNILNKSQKIMQEKAGIFVTGLTRGNDKDVFFSDSHGSFELLHLANPNYYDYKKNERGLESRVREVLVNPIFQELFALHDIDVKWPSSDKFYVAFDNEAIEDVAPFEFIVCTNGENIGYRYTEPYWEKRDVRYFFRKFRLNHVEIINWSYEVENGLDKIPWSVYPSYRDRVFYSSLKSLFDRFFSQEEYMMFLEICKEAVKKANDIIGFQTIPMLSLQNLPSFKMNMYIDLAQLDYVNLEYKVIPSAHKDSNELKKAKENADKRINRNDFKVIYDNFVQKRLFSALIGKNEFAKSFLTSEYMYYIFAGGAFDFTAIVCGYLKSIEQLAKKLLDITMDEFPDERLWIMKNRNNPTDKSHIRDNPAKEFNRYKVRPKQVLVTKENEKCFNTSMAPLTWFLHDNINGWNVSGDTREIIHGYLQNYTQECRNEHFHKDNIYSWDDVKNIRNNTLLIIFLLVGAYRLSEKEDRIAKTIGAVDYSFDILYKQIKKLKLSARRFIIQFDDNERVMAVLRREQDDPVYDKDGILSGCEIRFARVEEFDVYKTENDLDKCDKIIIDANHIPKKIWNVNGRGKEIPIVW